ncbi:MAG: ribonuclease P protein component [Clostridiales bacterium]|jgi:ribonuclease P protein component|nr:ribonuclease P protein component [Clostridiales bacterium]
MLAKANRLTKRGSFRYVYNKGERKSCGPLTLAFVKDRTLRVGFSVVNKVGKAVVRNKLKRRLRAAVRDLLPRLSPAQAVVSASPAAAVLPYAKLKSELTGLLRRAALLDPNYEEKA